MFTAGAFSKVVATKNEHGRWQLFGLCGVGNMAVFVEKARGGVREWSGLDYLAEFCGKAGIERWEVHARKINN
ncbi:hypothetical protein H8I91_24835 [Serratia fonticola]|nr:hypothetical protein [Serratia fonticola]UAN65939.1 hypothetical protein KGP16_27230 [Serratia sp. JSRIV006]